MSRRRHAVDRDERLHVVNHDDFDQSAPGKRRDLLHALADVAAAALDGDPDAERALHALLGPRWRRFFADAACASCT